MHIKWFAKPMPNGQKFRFGIDKQTNEVVAANPLPPQRLRAKAKARKR